MDKQQAELEKFEEAGKQSKAEIIALTTTSEKVKFLEKQLSEKQETIDFMEQAKISSNLDYVKLEDANKELKEELEKLKEQNTESIATIASLEAMKKSALLKSK